MQEKYVDCTSIALKPIFTFFKILKSLLGFQVKILDFQQFIDLQVILGTSL